MSCPRPVPQKGFLTLMDDDTESYRSFEEQMMASWTVVTVTLADREDGGLRVFSNDLPGLILSGSERKRVVASIIPAIKALFEHNGYRKVVVRPTKPVSEVLQPGAPRDMDVHVELERKQFIVEVSEAA